MYVLVSIWSGSSGMSTSKRDCTSSSFFASPSVDTNEIDRPLVPNLNYEKKNVVFQEVKEKEKKTVAEGGQQGGKF